MLFDIVRVRKSYKDVKYDELSTFAEAFLCVAEIEFRDCVATVFIERFLGQETSKKQWKIGGVVLRGTDTSLKGKVLPCHHFTQRWHAAVV